MNDKPRSITLQERKNGDMYYYDVVILYQNGKMQVEKTSEWEDKDNAYGAALSIADNFTKKEMTWMR